jgi:hypothetical protein
MSVFDTENFLSSSAGGTLSTERTLIPADTYANANIKDLKINHGIIGSGDNAGKPWVRLNVIWQIDSQELRDLLDRAFVTVTQGFMLDVTEDGELDTGKGKNVRLGKLKKALGLNEKEAQWAEFIGKYATIQVAHGVNGKDGSATEEVVAVAGH